MGDRDRRSPVRTPRGRHNGGGRRRSRADSYSDEYRSDDTDYSDSFVSDDDRSPPRRNKAPPPAKNTTKKPFSAPCEARKTTTAPYKGKGRRGRNGFQKAATDLHMNPIARIMQAERRMKANELKNALDGMTLKCQDLEEENKVLKRLQRRQEKALTKFEDKESDLPQILQRHTNEVRALKDQLRKVREKHSRTERSLHDVETEKEQLRRQVNKYRELAEDKGLPERDELHRRVLGAEADNQEKEKRVNELERHLEKLTKNHKHQIGIEMARHRELQRRHEEMTENYKAIQLQLKEKEKELDVKNIYANRMSRPPRQAVSYGGTPNESPYPNKANRQRRLSNSETTPRQKAKLYEQERREREKNKNEQANQTTDKLAWERLELDRVEAENVRQENAEKERRDRENREKKAEEEKAIRERVEHEEQEIRKRIEEEKGRKEREEKRLAEERLRKQHEERQEWEERERQEREEKQKREDFERKEQLKREQEGKAQQEREQMENDAKLQEERKRKDNLLARLKILDEGSDSKKEDNTPFFVTTEKTNSGASSSASKKSSYSFSQATENMHNGKPAYEENPVPYLDKRKNRPSMPSEEDGYMPSFGDPVKKPQQSKGSLFSTDTNSSPSSNVMSTSKSKSKKSNLMDELFGKNRDTTKTNTKNNNSDFNELVSFDSNNTPSRTKFPWDDASGDKVNLSSQAKPERQSSALYGGGSALIDDDSLFTENSPQLLPRRQRQQPTTFQTKPTVNAIDTFDDDIEEVVL